MERRLKLDAGFTAFLVVVAVSVVGYVATCAVKEEVQKLKQAPSSKTGFST